MQRGTTPEGTRNEREAAQYVREMFGRVAPRYDLLNRMLSLQIDQAWRRATVKALRSILDREDAVTLDLCCGTGDLLAMLRAKARGKVLGADFSHPMLLGSRAKSEAPLVEADGLQLPFGDGVLDLVTIAFGFRNFANYDAGLREMARVLKPGGTLAILEFSTPPNAWIRAGSDLYQNRILPWVGGWVSGEREAYRYLPSSVRKFPDAPELAARMEQVGLRTEFRRLTFGVVALHRGIHEPETRQ
jgi:demethylmenaquinone methyltransferase/2-methoxy-6-polyprenyl-1,4-benzoquinol methylase